MARIKYTDPVTHEVKYADLAVQLPFPSGSADNDIPLWDNTNGVWVVGQITDIIPDADNISY